MLPLMTARPQPPCGGPAEPSAGAPLEPAVAVWPLFGLELHAGDLELRPVREADAVALALLLPDDVELDPAAPRAGLGDGRAGRAAVAVQEVWRSWAGWTPARWVLPFTVRLAGELVGMQVLEGTDFPELRTVDSASWLVGRERGHGVGRRMREAVLALAFGELDAEYAITSAWADNAASLGVSRSLGYLPNGVHRHLRPAVAGGAGDMVHLRLARQDWRPPAPGAVRIEGAARCRPLFGLAPAASPQA